MTAWLPILLAATSAAVFAAPARDGALRLRAVAPVELVNAVPLVAGVAAAVVAVSIVLGPSAAALAAVGVVVGHRSVRRRRRAEVAARERACALDAMALLGADLRSGRTAADALAAAAAVACGDTAAALAAAAAAAGLGGDVVSALSVERSEVATTLRALATCWQVCSEAGSGLAAAVERLEQALRAADAQRRAVAAELAGPRATAQLLAVLPLVGVGLAAALGAHPLDLLLGTPLGGVCVVVGLTLDAFGVLWTRRLTERAMP